MTTGCGTYVWSELRNSVKWAEEMVQQIGLLSCMRPILGLSLAPYMVSFVLFILLNQILTHITIALSFFVFASPTFQYKFLAM